jgi:hypothetical protein
MALTLTFLSVNDTQYFPGYSCNDGETLLQVPVSTDKESAISDAFDGLMGAINELDENVALGYSDEQIKRCIKDALIHADNSAYYVNPTELGLEPDHEFDDLYSYWILRVTYDLRVTYQYGYDGNADNLDHGYAVTDDADTKGTEFLPSRYKNKIRLPLDLSPWSHRANYPNFIDPNLELTLDQLNDLCASSNVYDPMGKFASNEDLATYLQGNDHGWFTLAYTDDTQLGIHRIK